MRRTTKRGLLNLGLFIAAVCFLLLLNRSPSRSEGFGFPWTSIRYRTKSGVILPSRGVCSGLKESTKPALVVAHVGSDGDTSWLDALQGLYHLCLYTIDTATTEDYLTTSRKQSNRHLQVPANRGHEAMAYLTFLIDNYANIPTSGAVFVHGSRFAWHNDEKTYDNAVLLRSLNTSSALAQTGYHNMRCDWSAGTCQGDTPPQGSLETSWTAHLEPWNARAVSDSLIPQAFASLFGMQRASLGRRDQLRSQCCAQFVVSRENVWRHEREEYIALRQWLLEGGHNPLAAPPDDRISGRILSYMWHILFLGDAVRSGDLVELDRLNFLACPSAGECYCRLYGKCDLQTCTSLGRCQGEYVLPPDYKLPDGWEANHP